MRDKFVMEVCLVFDKFDYRLSSIVYHLGFTTCLQKWNCNLNSLFEKVWFFHPGEVPIYSAIAFCFCQVILHAKTFTAQLFEFSIKMLFSIHSSDNPEREFKLWNAQLQTQWMQLFIGRTVWWISCSAALMATESCLKIEAFTHKIYYNST